MGFAHLDIICARRPPLVYVSPPFCEADFSSTGTPVIMLTPIAPRGRITGLVISGDGSGRLTWDAVPGAICYNVYMAVDADDPNTEYVLVAECIPDPTWPPSGPGPFVITVITPDGESEPSDPIFPEDDSGDGAAPACAPEGGEAAPEGADAFDITGEIEWEVITINSATWVPWPGDPSYETQELETDYPPGRYDVKYVTGFFNDSDPASPCDPGTPSKRGGQVALRGLADDNHNIDTFTFIANDLYDIDPPNVTHPGQGISFCEVSNPAVEAAFQAFFNTGSVSHHPQAPRS